MNLSIAIKSLLTIAIYLLATCSLHASSQVYVSHKLEQQSLIIETTEGRVTLSVYTPEAIEVLYEKEHMKQLPSYAIGNRPKKVSIQLHERPQQLSLSTGMLTAVIDKDPIKISYIKDHKSLLAEEKGFFAHQALRGFRFKLDEDEKLMGGGQRVLGMDRRGHRLPLYNKAHYGYEGESEQMYFGLPAVMSNKKYILLFDNSAKGFMDLGHSEADILQFEAIGGRTSYLIIAGETYPELIANYVAVTGKQPLPPRWALGNFASRFGYRNEAQTRATVKKFQDDNFPLDAIILDLFWFGPDIQGHMGNLGWDRKAFPTPEKMIADFKDQGVKTILITEPFILTTSKRWQEAVAEDVLAKNLNGAPKRFDFYFGNTGLIDVFNPPAQDWFWNIYRQLMQQGVAGWWGDLGEPEVHPSDSIHSLGSGTATADEIHNVYGHQWAEMLFTRHQQDFPQQRPFIMMRSGFPGSQRYGMIPWTGDVSRSWEGLKPQIELGLQMSLLGMAYIHSDLGGFAGGEKFDREMYIRWLQYGVFQPIYRPHAQEDIAPEPVFHDRKTKNIIRKFIQLRYQMLPYNYTLAYDNSTTGMPLMRPLFFEDESKPELIDIKNSYLWGDAFLVAPVLEAKAKAVELDLPKGVWIDFWNGKVYQGDKKVRIPVSLNTIPVLVRAGSFIPMIDTINSTDHYSSDQLHVHYYADTSVSSATGHMYEDDGNTHRAEEKNLYELLRFYASHQQPNKNEPEQDQHLELTFNRELAGVYEGMPTERTIVTTVHNWTGAMKTIKVDGKKLDIASSHKEFQRQTQGAFTEPDKNQLHIKFAWNHSPLKIIIK